MNIGIDARLKNVGNEGERYAHSLAIGFSEFLDDEATVTLVGNKERNPNINKISYCSTGVSVIGSALARVLKKNHIDIFHTSNISGGLANKTIKNVFSVFHTAFIKDQTVAKSKREALQNKLAALRKQSDNIRLVVLSQTAKDDLIELGVFGASEIFVVPPGLEPKLYETPEGSLEEFRRKNRLVSRFLLVYGSIEPRRNIEKMLTAYADILRRVADAPPVLIVGEKGVGADKILSTIGMLSLERHVFYVEHVSFEELRLLYKHCECLVELSEFGGNPIWTLEAMACGAPVITSQQFASGEVVGEHGMLADINDQESIITAIEGIISSRSLRDDLRERSRREADRYSCRAQARRMLEVYK